jgi:hypothetical protein
MFGQSGYGVTEGYDNLYDARRLRSLYIDTAEGFEEWQLVEKVTTDDIQKSLRVDVTGILMNLPKPKIKEIIELLAKGIAHYKSFDEVKPKIDAVCKRGMVKTTRYNPLIFDKRLGLGFRENKRS